MPGICLAPNGNFAKHLKVMKKKADTFSICICSSRLTPQDIRTFHKTMYFPSMRYSLAAMAVDEEELHTLQTKLFLPCFNILVRAVKHQRSFVTAQLI
jgi:hypothetical protein